MACDEHHLCCNTERGDYELHDPPEPIIHKLAIVGPETKQAFECYGDDSLTCCDFEHDVHVLAFGRLVRLGSLDSALAQKLRGRVSKVGYLLIDPLLCRPESEAKRREPPDAGSTMAPSNSSTSSTPASSSATPYSPAPSP